MIEKGRVLNSVMSAQESDLAYEVVGQILKNVSDTTDKLIDLQKKMKDIDDSHATQHHLLSTTLCLLDLLQNCEDVKRRI